MVLRELSLLPLVASESGPVSLETVDSGFSEDAGDTEEPSTVASDVASEVRGENDSDDDWN